MFRTELLVSTAMTAVALLLSGAPTAAQTNMHVTSRDPNTRFLCSYGAFSVDAESYRSSGFFSSGWENVAVPITGHGQTVSRIRVVEAPVTRRSDFMIGIYSNTASGLPGSAIAVGTGRITRCKPVEVLVAPTMLKRKTTYWIEETVQGTPHRQETYVEWEANPDTTRKAYTQYHKHASSSGRFSSYTSPWTQQTTGPYLTLK